MNAIGHQQVVGGVAGAVLKKNSNLVGPLLDADRFFAGMYRHPGMMKLIKQYLV